MLRYFAVLAALAIAGAAVAASSPGFNPADLDRSVSPAQNFYQFANGGWQKSHLIPPDYSRWGTFTLLHVKNQQRLKKLVEEVSKEPGRKPGSEAQMVGDFYASGMNLQAINRAGIRPLLPQIEEIAKIHDRKELAAVLARLQARGVNVFFRFGSEVSRDNSARTIGGISQGGLGLPDRDYYLKNSARNRKVRAAYRKFIIESFVLAGRTKSEAQRAAEEVMSIETVLAKASLSRVARRNPYAIWHPGTLKRLRALAPGIDWNGYFSIRNVASMKSLNIAEPKFFTAVSRLVKHRPLPAVKTYLEWHLLMAASPFLSENFERARFAYISVLTGQKRPRPRWMRVLAAENGAVGFALGKLYVKRYFPPREKAAVESILANVRAALAATIRHLAWMSAKTRKAALKKLAKLKPMIGYPDHWRTYKGLEINRGPYVLNIMRAARFNSAWDLALIGKPTDRSIWYMTPQTVNAYYDPSTNQIVFPAAILQPPFYNPKAPLALNYGAVGAVMGHEITHGFDDQGRHFDAEGNLKDWWTKADAKRFESRANCITRQFSGYTVAGGEHVNGKLVTGEAIADLGGVTLAYRAFEKLPAARSGKTYDNFSPSQLFFLGFAHVWAANIRPAAERLQVSRDPHPPAVYRVNGTLANVPTFWKSFNIPRGAAMRHRSFCQIW